jgi:hypothetical protein
MSVGDNDDLLEKLIETRSATRALLKDVDPEMRVYTDPEWRIRDILGHIATWDRQVAKSLRAFRAGTEYFIPDIDEDESDLLYPWGGERGSIAKLIDYMIDHEDEHRDEIEKAIKASAEN